MKRGAELFQNLQYLKRLLDVTARPIREKYGLSALEMDILAFLAQNPQLDTASDIVNLRLLPKANVSQAVDSMVRKGLLAREQDAKDRRQVHLHLCGKAMDWEPEIRWARTVFENVLFADFSTEERNRYAELNDRILQNAKEYLEGK